MFKLRDKIFPSALAPHAKFKQQVQSLSAIFLLLSLLLVDVVNIRTGSHLYWMFILIKNIPMILPWCVAYLVTSRYKELLKICIPLYLSLVLLVGTIFSALSSFAQAENLERKFYKEAVYIVSDMESSSQSQLQTYSTAEYGMFAPCLNKLKELHQLFNKETEAIMQASNEVELDKIFTEEVIFNSFNIIEKKQKLKQFILFLDASLKRAEDRYSECVKWGLSSPEVNKAFRQSFAKIINEENKFLSLEPYRIKKNIVQKHIEFLEFFSKRYGMYEINEEGRILFTNDNDILVWKSLCEKLGKVYEERDNFIKIFEVKTGKKLALAPSSHKTNASPAHVTERNRLTKEEAMIEIVAKDGAKASISAISLEYSMFQLKGEGFKPCESLNIISHSGDETLNFPMTANKKGNILPVGMMPAVIGKSGGICYIDILREEDSIHIKLPWGTETLKNHSNM